MPFRTYRRDVNPFETDTKGKLFVVDVSINWPSNRDWQTKVLDSWKATQRILLRQKSVKETESRWCNCLVGLVVRRPSGDRQTFVRFPLSPWIFFQRYLCRRTCSHTSPRRLPTLVTLHDTRFVKCRWWNDGWTMKTVVT